ncbi:pentatricopeptide repeat domain-containing protein [Pseudomassariella vexata]|uniref:Pentatricopeptide repeat domain-containing protein n=1 Tax=Pseudomassariella vexata TaxID=1141098 RepID=A0A1Y2DK34_9PEZI|nr:pentatricopeptide repeat domain-containing protein [Pseudomassariella vexata]ORY59628.1 pentatricopeptide repeat domain-containing protein [Pseudomassariella vexata]
MPLFNSLAQRVIQQGFSKSLTHGYAQSLVAGTHLHTLNAQNRPTFSRRHSQRIGPLSTLQLQGQGAFHSSASAANATQEHRHDRLLSNHGGLDAYFEALQNRQEHELETGEVQTEAEKEWTQFQFPKQIEWKPSVSTVIGESKSDVQAVNAVEAARDESDAPVAVPAEAALAHIDAALKNELEVRQLQEALEEISLVVHSRALSPIIESARSVSPASIARTATPPVDSQSQSYADHLTKLAEDGRFAEIPAVFEAMLVANIKPIASAYNALLNAAIRIPMAQSEVVSKALDVYSDMMRRKVTPDSETYNILLGLLAARCLEVSSLKKDLEVRRTRFGGMDERGTFMFASYEMDHAILSEELDRLDLALKLFESSVVSHQASYSSEVYHQLISACAQAGRITDMLQLFDHMEHSGAVPFAATFPTMITAFSKLGDLASAVECYNEYKELAIAHDSGRYTLNDRLDSQVYAAVINGYVINDKPEGAMKFYERIVSDYGVRVADMEDALISGGFVNGFMERGIYQEALQWAQGIENESRLSTMATIATTAADNDDQHSAVAAFANIPSSYQGIATPAMALLALSVRAGDVAAASQYWHILSNPEVEAVPAFIEPTAMYAVAMIGSGQVAEGLAESELMFQRIRAAGVDARPQLVDEIQEGIDFISKFMSTRGIIDPRHVSPVSFTQQTFSASPYPSTPTVSSYEDNFDPYAYNTDFKGSSIISDELEGAHGRKGPRINEALTRFRNMRRAGRHPRYITYAKMISAAAREGKMDMCHDILVMARTDVPLLPQFAVVRYGWSSILDAMVGACLTLGDRTLAEQYHLELLEMGSAPSANTFGLYITTLKESTKTFDEATEAVKIFHRAKSEGVEPSSFLYNALIGKLGKARRIDDCLFFFAEMRALGIKPTSVTYGTIVNALCRVSDEKFAEELFDEMEAMPNYKARPAPYNSMMQFFLTTKRDKAKVLAYYERMKAKGIAPTAHTYKLLVDTHATLEPVNMTAAEAVLDMIRSSGQRVEPVHYASLIHARGCVLHDMAGAKNIFDSVMSDPSVPANPCLFQALFEAMVANHHVADTEAIVAEMRRRRVELTPYIANTLIHGWAGDKNIEKANSVYNSVSREKREPSTYEAMTRAYLAVEDRNNAKSVVHEMLTRGYPSAVVNKVLELLGGGSSEEVATA